MDSRCDLAYFKLIHFAITFYYLKHILMPPFSLVNLFLLHILTGDISVVTVHFALSNTVGSLYQSIAGSSTRKNTT